MLDRSGAKSYYFGDGLGSIRELADARGTGQNSYSYGAWGELRASSVTVGNSYGYTGREFAEEGRYFYRARYLDPGLGRFVSRDLFRPRKGGSFYSYVPNNPVLCNDPSGLWHYKTPPWDPRTVWPANPDVESRLDCLQQKIGGFDFTVTEGRRFWGDPTSAHWTGDAADISGTRHGMDHVWSCKVLAAAKKCGFKRVCKHRILQHYHVDTDPNDKGGVCGGSGWEDYYDPCELCKTISNICCRLFH